MNQGKARETAYLHLALPADVAWLPKVGESVLTVGIDGDPRDKATSLRSAFVVPKTLMLGPMFRSDFIPLVLLTRDERKLLEDALEALLNEEALNQIVWAIRQMIATTALCSRLPSWRDFESRLRKIVKVGKLCIKAAGVFENLANPSGQGTHAETGIISLDQAVKAYISLYQRKPVELRIDIAEIIRLCEDALKTVKPKASQRGRKADSSLKRFLESILIAAHLAGIKITLPSNESKGKFGSQETTPVFKFARTALTIATAKARMAVQALRLTDDERTHAQCVLGDYTNKSHGALLEQLRQARRAVHAQLPRPDFDHV